MLTDADIQTFLGEETLDQDYKSHRKASDPFEKDVTNIISSMFCYEMKRQRPIKKTQCKPFEPSKIMSAAIK